MPAMSAWLDAVANGVLGLADGGANRTGRLVDFTAGLNQIILPYAVSDTFSNFATIKIDDLMRSITDA